MASSSLIFSKAALAAFGDSGLENLVGSLDAMFGIGLIFSSKEIRWKNISSIHRPSMRGLAILALVYKLI